MRRWGRNLAKVEATIDLTGLGWDLVGIFHDRVLVPSWKVAIGKSGIQAWGGLPVPVKILWKDQYTHDSLLWMPLARHGQLWSWPNPFDDRIYWSELATSSRWRPPEYLGLWYFMRADYCRLVVNLISFLGGDIGCIISRSHFGTIMVRSCQWGQKQVEAEPTQGQQHHETHRLKLPFSNLKACTASMPCHARELFNVMSWLLGRGSESSRVTDPKCVCTVPINPSVSLGYLVVPN